MNKIIAVHESEWDRLEAENKVFREAVVTGVRCMEQRNEALAEIKRLEKIIDDVCYTAKNRKRKMHKYRDALRSIGNWSQVNQDEAESIDKGCLMMWRGCVAEANLVLDEENDNE